MTSLEIRRLEPGEAGRLSRHADGVFDRAIDPVLAAEFLADPRHHVVVAIEDDRVVGMATGVHYVHPDKPAELFINEVGVATSHRRRGIARGLLTALFAHARSLGCVEAWVLADPENRSARALYRATGGGEGTPAVMFSYRLTEQGTDHPNEA